jgi:fibronectin-binding autotransporter adhesin
MRVSITPVVFLVLWAVSFAPENAVARIWISGNGSWANPSNWNNNFSPGMDDFSALDITADTTVFLNGNQSSRVLAFGDTIASHNWILAPGGPTSSMLTLDVTSGEPIVEVVNQAAIFNVVVAGNEGLTKTGLGSLVLTKPNTYSGTTVVRSGTLVLDYSASGLTSDILPGPSELRLGSLTAAAGGGTIKVIGAPGASIIQSFGGTTMLFGQNGIAIDQNDAASVELSLGFFDRDVGSVAVFTLPSSGAIHAFDATVPNINGILGAWATIGSGANATWAANDGTGKIVRYSAFTEITGSPMIASDPTTNVRWSESTGDANVAAGTTDINTLLFADAARRTIAIPAGVTLRVGVSGGFLKTDVSGGEESQLTIGLRASFLTAGGAPGSVGELILNSNASAPDQNGIVVNSSIVNNGIAPVTVIKSGSAAALMTASNSYSGGTYVTSGRLGSNTGGGFGVGAVHVATGAQLFIGGGTHANEVFISGRGLPQPNQGALRFEGAAAEAQGKITLLDDALITTSLSTAAVVLSGQITGEYGLEFSGRLNGAITLANSMNNWTGNTTIGSGILRIGGAGEVIPHVFGRGNVIMYGDPAGAFPSVLDLNGRTETINGLSSVGDPSKVVIRSDSPGPAMLRIGNGIDTDFTFAGTIADGAGTVGITKIGNRTLTLSGANSYSGRTVFDEGVLRLGSASALPMRSALEGDGGQLDLNGFDITVSSLTGRGSIYSNSSTSPAQITFAGGNSIFPGSIVIANAAFKPVGLTVTDGMLTMSGPNFFMGPTSLNGGTLSVTGFLDSAGAVTVNAGGTLSGNGTFNNGRVGHVTMQPGSRVRPGTTSADGAVGTLTMSSLTVNGGELRFDLAGGGTSDRVNVVGTATFTAPATIAPVTVVPGVYTLLTADTLRGVPPTLSFPTGARATFGLNFETLADQIRLIITGSPPKSLTWTGANSAAWDLNTTANWTDGTNAETFFNLDSVTFPDAAANRNIVLNTTVVPTSVVVNNSPGNDYSFTGAGSIGDGIFTGTTLTKRGAGTLTLGGTTTYNAPISVEDGLLRTTGSIAINGVVTVIAPAKLVVEGTASIGGIAGTGTTEVGDDTVAAELNTAFIRQTSLSIAPGSVVRTNPGDGTSVLETLLIPGPADAPAAKFDLNNAAVLNYTGASPVTNVRSQILAGRDGAGLGSTWTGMGITSSAAATAVATEPESRSVGYAENATLPLGAYTTFRGQPVDDTSILMLYTRTGDANLDGLVNDDDVTIVGATYAPGVPNASWANGDFDYNGFVDDDDVTLLGAFYDPSAAPLAAPAAAAVDSVAAVPEPPSLVLVMIGTALSVFAAKRRTTRRANCTNPAVV